MILLDSSILIELFRKKDKNNTLFYKLFERYDDLFISSITYYEIGIGNRKSHYDFWNEFCENIIVLPFDKECAINAISIYQNLKTVNKIIDIADIFIGATAITHRIPVATLNIKHFERIKELDIMK